MLQEHDYCPPIDPALFHAITSDYDLSNTDSVRQLRAILDALKVDAIAQEAAEFDPSGSSGGALQDVNGGLDPASSDDGRSNPDSSHRNRSRCHETDLTSLSQSISALGLDNESAAEYDSHTDYEHEWDEGDQADISASALGLNALAIDQKLLLMEEMFPSLQKGNINAVLVKEGEDFDKTVEALLTQVFLSGEMDAGGIAKGIDGFQSDANEHHKRGRRKRRKNGRRSSSVPAPLTDVTNAPRASRWESMKEDVNFITLRTGWSPETVSSLYHKNGASLSAALRAILEEKRTLAESVVADDSDMQRKSAELGRAYPLLAPYQTITIVYLTATSGSDETAAQELARALLAVPRHGAPAGLEIVTRLPPIELQAPLASSHLIRPGALGGDLTLTEASTKSATYDVASRAAYAQASAAYRKSKSNHLMSAAAAHYSNVGREYGTQARSFGAAAADALVGSQSTAGQLDLHGVSVKDAIRIAREQVTMWWVAVEKARGDGRGGGSHHGYRIVTGSGKHSEGGRGKIGPAVGRMLIREGWKTEMGTGSILVTGVVKRH